MSDGRISAEAWNAWLKSDMGQKCATPPADGEYLKNRLWWAFMAGYKAAEKVRPVGISPEEQPK